MEISEDFLRMKQNLRAFPQKTLEEAMYNDSFVFHAKLKGALK